MYKIYVPTIITNGHFNKEKTLAELKRVKADNVVLALERRIGHSFSTPKELELLAELIKYFDENGVESSVWLGETFGHSGGPAGKDSPYTNIRTLDGEDIEAFCPMDESFTRDFCDWVVKVARCGARLILLDDDFRLGFRGNGVIGCFCKHHMAALERELGESITLEAAEFSTRYPSLYFATGLNLPISYEPDGVNILFGENARFVSRDELKNGSVIDIAAARHLAERGIDVGIKSFDGALGGDISEYFTDEGIYTRLEAGVYCENAKIADSAIIRSELVVDGKHFPLSYTYENAQGERFLVNLFDAQDAMIKFGWFLSYARSRMVSKLLPWLGKNHKDVHVIGNYPYIYLLAKEDERELSIGVWNLFEDPAKSVRLSVPYEIKDIEFIGCMGGYDGNIITLDGDIRAFGQAFVRIVK